MLRKLNFTARLKIPRSAVTMTVRRDGDGVLVFDPAVNLAALRAPSAARVYIEAYYRSSYMRFDCGTVGEFSPPADRRLVDIDSDNVVRFRVKVVDNSGAAHRIVAVADDISASASDAAGTTKQSLLPVNFRDLGDQVWRITYDTNGALLELNRNINGIELLAKSDARFFALVYPAAVREILTNILIIEEYAPSEDADEWLELWLRWGADLAGSAPPETPDERRDWIEDVVNAFCGQHEVARRFAIVEGEI